MRALRIEKPTRTWSGPMQQDAMNLSNSGVVGLPTVDCRDVTTTGSTPGAEIVNIDQLEPLACITAFRHLHSTTVPQDTDFPIIPVINDSDPRDPMIYPPGIAIPTLRAGSGEVGRLASSISSGCETVISSRSSGTTLRGLSRKGAGRISAGGPRSANT